MEAEGDNKRQGINLSLDPKDEVKNTVASYRLNISEPIESVLFTDRKKPSAPQCRWGFWHDPQLPLLCGLGMPGQVERVLILEPGKLIHEKYVDFTIELFGVRGTIPDDFPFPSWSEAPDKHWSIQQAERVMKLDGLKPGGYTRFRESDTHTIIDMEVWRHRVYLDDSPIYVENLWSASTGWVPMICGIQFADPAKTIAQLKQLADGFMLGFLAEDELLIRERRGGAHNVKVADLSDDIRKALGKRYVELRNTLSNVKKEAKTLGSFDKDWHMKILKRYPALESHTDLLDDIDGYDVPSDENASVHRYAPWEIAIEIAARETIPGYTNKKVTPETLRNTAIRPE